VPDTYLLIDLVALTGSTFPFFLGRRGRKKKGLSLKSCWGKGWRKVVARRSRSGPSWSTEEFLLFVYHLAMIRALRYACSKS